MSGQETDNKEAMQTVVSSYVTPNLIEQVDIRLTDNGSQYDARYIDYQYNEEKSPEEKINVDGEDKDEELIITDDVGVEAHSESHVNIGRMMQDERQVVRREDRFKPSWHPHVYGKPPKKPTPHTIEYILGLNERKMEEPKRSVSQLINVKRNFDTKKPYCTEKSIQVQTDLPEKKFSLSAHKNKLQEQLLQRGLRTSESEFEKVPYSFRVEDQPLNLSVPKSKECGWSSTDEEKYKGQYFNVL